MEGVGRRINIWNFRIFQWGKKENECKSIRICEFIENSKTGIFEDFKGTPY